MAMQVNRRPCLVLAIVELYHCNDTAPSETAAVGGIATAGSKAVSTASLL